MTSLFPPTRCRITRQDFATAVSEGLSITDAACRFQVTPNTVRNWERRFDFRCRRKRRLPLATEEVLRKLVAEGFNSVQMGERLKASPGGLYYYFRKYGIDYQPHRTEVLKFPEVNLDRFARQVRKNFTKATVLVRGTAVMVDGELVGERGRRWFREKVRTAFPRRRQFSL